MRPPYIYRKGAENLIALSCYARGDGYLGFTAFNVHTKKADPTPMTEAECKSVCPYGFIVVKEGEGFYARKVDN